MPSVPGGSVAVVTFNAAAIVIVNVFVAVAGAAAESFTWNVTDTLFAASNGIPLTTPVGLMFSPAGNKLLPGASDHVYGAVPPVAASVVVYAIPTSPFGKGLAVVIVSAAALIVSVSAALVAVACGTEESFTWNITVDVPPAVGVPPITPAALTFIPAGSVLPGASDHV